MTGAEFREARAAAGLSVRKAADALGVAPSTIQRWQMDESRIPSEIAARLMALAAAQPDATARTLGRLFAVLELAMGAQAPRSVVGLLKPSPAAAFGQMFALLATKRQRDSAPYRAYDAEIESLVGDIAAYPPFLPSVAEADFWLGYYRRRAHRGPLLETDITDRDA